MTYEQGVQDERKRWMDALTNNGEGGTGLTDYFKELLAPAPPATQTGDGLMRLEIAASAAPTPEPLRCPICRLEVGVNMHTHKIICPDAPTPGPTGADEIVKLLATFCSYLKLSGVIAWQDSMNPMERLLWEAETALAAQPGQKKGEPKC